MRGEDERVRCSWGASTPDYQRYHDREWGTPVTQDRRLFEKICLEGFQSGLSWRTILAKRENFRAAFAGFDFERVSRFDEADVARLLQDAGIVRHRGKIAAAINNARRVRELIAQEGSFAAYVWGLASVEIVRWIARRRLATWQPDDSTFRDTRLTVDGDGVVGSDSVSTSRYSWPAFSDVTEQAGLILLWMDRGAKCLIVPARALAHDAARRDFVTFVRERIAQAAAA